MVMAAAFAMTVTFAMTMTTTATFAFAMTMTTTATFAFAMTVTTTATFTFAMTMTSTFTIATAVATTAHSVYKVLNFFVRSFTHRYNLALKMKVLTCKRMVKVYNHSSVFHFEYQSMEALTISVHQRYNSTGINHFSIKLTIHNEDIFLQFEHTFLLIIAISVSNSKVEVVAFSQFQDFIFKSIECHTHT